MNRETLRKYQFPLMLALLLYPICALGLGYADMNLLKWRWVLPGLFLVFSCLAMPIPGKFRLGLGVAGAAALVMLGGYLAGRGMNWKVWLLGIGSAAALLWSMKIGGWKNDREIDVFWIIGGLASQLAVRVIMIAMENTRGLTLDGIVWELNLAFFAFVILAMISMNRSALNSASLGRTAASRSMRRKNILLILAVFAISLLVSLLPIFLTAAQWAAVNFGKAVMWFTSLFGGDAPAELPPDAPSPAPEGGEKMEFSPFVLFAGKVIALVFVVFIAFQLFRALREVVKGIMDRLSSFTSDAGEDFVDEVSDIREEEDHQVRTRRLFRFEERDPDGLAPVQQVRRQYRRLLRAHRDWGDARTARENIPDDLARIYEQARYSGSDVTEAQASAFRAGTKNL